MRGAKDEMTLIALELPDEIRDWPTWLENQLVGLQLRELVQQIELIGGELDEPLPAIDSVLGDRRQAVLDEGLTVLDESQLRAVVRHPRLLLTLQEMVLVHGGRYWRTVERTQEHARLVSHQWQNLVVNLDRNAASLGINEKTDPTATYSTPTVDRPLETTYTTHRGWLMGLAALAATTLLIFCFPLFRTTDGRFFAAREIRESQMVGKDYLQLIGNRIQNDWKSDLDDQRAFANQLKELRNSCDVLLALDLHQLNPTIAADLKKRCQNWKAEFSKHIAELASGTPLVDVRAKSNALVDRLTQAITNLAA